MNNRLPFNNIVDLRNKFNQFVQEYNDQWNSDPKQKVQELLDSGKMTKQQYDNFRQIANNFLGTNY